MNENENTTTQNLQNTVKAVLRGRFTALQAYLKKQEKSQINNLNSTHKATRKGRNEEPQGKYKERNLKNQGRNKCKRNKATIAKINKAESWFSEKINKINKSLARLTKKKREKNQINKIRNENGEITTGNTEIQRIIRDYYQQLYANKMDNLEEIDKFLEKYSFPKLNQKKQKILTDPSQAWELKL